MAPGAYLQLATVRQQDGGSTGHTYPSFEQKTLRSGTDVMPSAVRRCGSSIPSEHAGHGARDVGGITLIAIGRPSDAL